TDQLDLQLGGRDSYIVTKSPTLITTGPAVAAPAVTPALSSSDNPLTYSIAPQYKIFSDLMVYARLASGYQPGAPNNYTISPVVPHGVNAAKTESYEIGIKGDLLDRYLTVDASLYYIDFNGIQVRAADPSGISYTTNGGTAKSEGFEIA